MKKRTRNKLLAIATAILLAAVMIVPSLTALKVSAAPGDPTETGTGYKTSPTDRTETDAMKITIFKKNFQIRNDCNIPQSEFVFAITPGSVEAATTETLAVIPGITEGLQLQPVGETKKTATTASITYAAQTKQNLIDKQSTPSACDYVTYYAPTGEDYYLAIKEMTIDFSAVVFPEPGVYRYIITESGNNPGVTPDPVSTRTLDVYVVDDTQINTSTNKLEKRLKIDNYVLYVGTIEKGPKKGDAHPSGTTYTVEDGQTVKEANGLEPVANATTGDVAVKSVGFINKYPSASLTFGKIVKGNQGSRDKYFKYTLNITNGVPNSYLDVDYTYADKSISKNPNAATTCIEDDITQPSVIQLDATGGASKDFYLQDGQFIIVNGFIKDMVFNLSEAKEDYDQSFGIAAADSIFDFDGNAGNDAMNAGSFANGTITGTFDTKAPTDPEVVSMYTGFTNTRAGVIPTGVILSVAPWAIAGVVILAGVVFFAIRSRKKYEEE